MSGPAHTPNNSSASSNPANRFDQSLNRSLSKITAARMREINPPQTRAAQIVTTVCRQFVPGKAFQCDAIKSPPSMEVRMVTGVVNRVIRRSNKTRDTAQISVIKNNVPNRYPECLVRSAIHRREKSRTKLPAAANPPLAKASAVPTPENSSTRKYQADIGDLQYRHFPLSQSQLRIGMLSLAST
jgi:hypothetical protein